ncbi:hypothetical protein [Streptomyces sp. NPDC059262]|uniref:hypothetical protein n=1 Tax=Streptomyces sp. NPDC059262 TaxID=3346797 RepID=UPI0036908B95
MESRTQRLPAPDQHGMDEQAELVAQVVLHEGRREIGPAERHVPAGPLSARMSSTTTS